MKKLTGLVIAVALMAGCTPADERIQFDGQFYNAKLRKVDRQRDVFTVTVRPVSRSVAGAREAGAYEATVYCVNTFGSSDIIWSAGPDAPDGELRIENDTLTLLGRCPNAT